MRLVPGGWPGQGWLRQRSRRWLARVQAALLAVAALAAAGCASAAPSPAGATHHSGPRVVVRVKSLHGIGQVLITARGYVLYMFEPDHQRQVTCASLCAATWPPLRLPADATLVAGPGVRQDLLGSDPGPAGGRVVTYNGWPLYTYTGDVQPGQYTGQAIDLNGGPWYVLRPSGQPLESVFG
jgi:predicted lipoprotein with Yx(FWY)xxD motif